MNQEDSHDESDDTSDEDYMPGNKPEEAVSEVESDGDPEDDALSDGDTFGKKSGKRKRTSACHKRRKIAKESELDNEDNKEAKKALTDEEKKKKDDDLWSDFMKDTGFQSKKSTTCQAISSNSTRTKTEGEAPSKISSASNKPADKVKITQVFEFAGEEVKVEKEVSASSAEARLLGSKSTAAPGRGGRPKGSLSGIGNVLSQLGKKQKISTLEKSKLDWDRFKKEENLAEELETHNKGKDGYLERQDFLQRADLRRFEIEKEIRTIERNKRMTN